MCLMCVPSRCTPALARAPCCFSTLLIAPAGTRSRHDAITTAHARNHLLKPPYGARPASAQNWERHRTFVIMPRPKTLPQHPSIASMCLCGLTRRSPSPWSSSGYKTPQAGALAFPIYSVAAWWPHQLVSTWRRGEGKEKRGGEREAKVTKPLWLFEVLEMERMLSSSSQS
jgi:hypothetical protein